MQSVEALANGQANKMHRPKDASTQKLLNIINGQSLLPSQAKPNKWEKKSVKLISHGGKKGENNTGSSTIYLWDLSGKYLDPWNKTSPT